MISNERIFITGGAGFLGRHVIERYYGGNQITVFSRDEAKHYYLKKKFPKVNFIVGDVRNFDLLNRAIKGHTIGIFAASMKQIEAVNDNYEEANEVIVKGAFNSKRASLENRLKSACFISSDKSRAATTIYGAMKFIAGEAFIRTSEPVATSLSCAVYGNVVGSTGSVVPLIWDAIKHNYSLTLYSPEMTRFMLTVHEAIELIELALRTHGFNVIFGAPSFRIVDLFEIYASQFGLKYSVGKPRASEKLHELLIAEEEVPRVTRRNGYYLMHYERVFNEVSFEHGCLSSEYSVMGKERLNETLANHSYFK